MMLSSGFTRLRLLTAALMATLLAPALVTAQTPAVPISEIDKIFSWATPDAPGCVVAVSHHGKLVVNRAYGLADLERKVPLTADSVFDAGSVVKQFVAASVLLLVQEKRLSLSEDIRKYIPELPDYGHKITLDHLLTHTSGIRDWTGMLPLTAGTVDALTLTLRQRGLNFAPGEEWAYSNGGYVLLKEIVARTSGMSFGDFTRKRLFEPLGMKSSAYLADGRVLKNLAFAYEKSLVGWKQDMLFDNARGGGGALFTTARDLVIWNDALTNKRLGGFVSDALQEPAKLGNGKKLEYARGLFLGTNRGSRVIWHTGSAAAYKALAARFPEQGLSIGIVCNSGDSADRTNFASQIFDLFVPGSRNANAEGPDSSPVGGDVAAGDVKSRTGLYFSEKNGQPLRLVVDGARMRIAGGPAMLTLANDRFRRIGTHVEFMSGYEFELHFLSSDLFALKVTDGPTIQYRRAQSYTPSAEDLKAFAGRYESDEIGAVFETSAGKDGLMLRLNNRPPLEFRPVDRDTFQLGGMVVRFRRDSAGRVVALDYSNPVVRNIAFARAGDRTGGR
jgi:CubicO group peptidase (beta-lactamase class C family)